MQIIFYNFLAIEEEMFRKMPFFLAYVKNFYYFCGRKSFEHKQNR